MKIKNFIIKDKKIEKKQTWEQEQLDQDQVLIKIQLLVYRQLLRHHLLLNLNQVFFFFFILSVCINIKNNTGPVPFGPQSIPNNLPGW